MANRITSTSQNGRKKRSRSKAPVTAPSLIDIATCSGQVCEAHRDALRQLVAACKGDKQCLRRIVQTRQ